VLISGTWSDPSQAFLVVDKHIVCEVADLLDIPYMLMAAFFVFNIHYTQGCNNFYSFMEVVTLNFPGDKASPTVKHVVDSIV
jgi:hypothetical protein